MRRLLLFLALAAIGLLAQPASQHPDAREALNRGVAAFKDARYSDAVTAFQEAIRLEPGNINPHLYLATAYIVQWIPGNQSPENLELASKAEAEFRRALDVDPRDKTAIASLASLAFNKAKGAQVGTPERARHFEDAEGWYRKLLEVDTIDKLAYYSLGVIQWERFYPELMAARTRLGMRPEDPGPLKDSGIRLDLRTRFGRNVEDGMAALNRAVEIDPLYDDAMAYLNLLYRERADYSESADDYKRGIEAADALVTRALDARKRKAEGNTPYTSAPPPPPPPAPGTERIRVGGNVQASKLIQKTTPVYPPLAKQARVQGTVRFSVVIGKDGHVVNVQLVSGHPLLVPAAVEAVKTWVYDTTLLNGLPVEVITQVDVNFTLSN